jgi:hypothetical protein
MPADSKTLIEKIEALPAERIAEIRQLLRPSGAIPKTTSTMPFDFGDVVLVALKTTTMDIESFFGAQPAVLVTTRRRPSAWRAASIWSRREA